MTVNLLEERRTLRERVLEVILADEFVSIKRLCARLEGHPGTWRAPDRSNLRRLVAAMVERGELMSRFNVKKNRHEYAREATLPADVAGEQSQQEKAQDTEPVDAERGA